MNKVDIITLDLSVARVLEPLPLSGNFLKVVDASSSGAEISLRVEGTFSDPVTFRLGRFLKSNDPFTCLYITNTAQAGVTMSLMISDSESVQVGDDRVDTAAASASIAAAVVALTENVAQIRPMNTGRRSVTCYNEGGSPCRIGGPGVTFAAGGILLPVGSSISIDTTAALYGICDNQLTTALSYIEELS